MLPTFFGLNTVTRALLAQQEAVDIVNQNISNASTPGYSAQSPVIEATDPYTVVAFDRPALAGQIGTGAQVTKITRFQDELLNSQIRANSQTVGQLQVMDDHFTHIQSIFNDPSNVALNSAASDFFNAIHDLSNNPESASARQAVQETGSTLANALGTRYTQLTSLQSDLNSKVLSIVGDINSTINQIAVLNRSIAQSTGIGDNANDLMDQRDRLVDHLSTLIDVRDVKNPDGSDTIQMNGRFLVNKDQAYTLTTLTDASSSALVKPVKVFWQEDVTKFQNTHVGYDPITGRNLTTNAPLVAGVDVPPLSVAQASISTGSLFGTMDMRDRVIQNTLIPQLNELADSLTNTQALSLKTGLTSSTSLSGPAAAPDDFTVTVLTPQGTATPPGPGQIVTFSVGSASPTTVQNVIDAINSSSVSPYVHASLNAAGQLQIDTIVQGALVKVDQANGAASKDFGFSAAVADGFNMVHVQGYGLTTPPQWASGIAGLTLETGVAAGDGLRVTGPDGAQVDIVVPPPSTAGVANTVVVNGGDVSGAAVFNPSSSQQPSVPGQLSLTLSGGTGPFPQNVTIVGTDADGNPVTDTVTFSGNGTLTTRQIFKTVTSVTSPAFGGTAKLTVLAPNAQPTVADLINVINAHNRTDTQVVATAAGLTNATALSGGGNFVITVVTPTGQTVTFNPSTASPAPSTVGGLLDAINGVGSYSPNAVSAYIHASLNNAGHLVLDAIVPGTLVKADQANALTATQFGLQTGVVATPIGQVHGFQASLDHEGRLVISSQPTDFGQSGQVSARQAQDVGTAVTTATTAFAGGGTITIEGPNGRQTFTTGGVVATVNDLINAINAAGLGITAGLNSSGHFQLFTQQTGADVQINITGVSGADITTTLGLNNGSFTATNHGYPPSASVTVAKVTGGPPYAVTSSDFYGTPETNTDSNQFFFQGSTQNLPTQVVASASAAGAQTFTQLAGPAQLSVSIANASAFAPGTVTVVGVDATTGAAANETLTFTANGVKTTNTVFKSITSITAAGFTSGTIQVVSTAAGTQKDTAGAVAVDGNILNDAGLIATSSVPREPGNADIALALLNVQQQDVVTNGQAAATIGDFYSSMTEDLGASAQVTHTNLLSQQQLGQHLTNQKQSIVGVNLDEEAARLVALQHAYQAAARAITSQDSMLDTIINGMGLVGRS